MTAKDGNIRPLSVLVVDDSEDTAESMAMILQLNGYRVSIARTGVEALTSTRLDAPDAVLLDLRLPDLNGWEVARLIRQRSDGKRPMVIAITGCSQPSDRVQSTEVGIDLHLIKPVDPEQLLAVLRRFSEFVQPMPG